jgi:hypothetical protein
VSSARVAVVTGYVEIPNTNRSPGTYHELGAELSAAAHDAGVPLYKFVSGAADGLWLRRMVDGNCDPVAHAEYNNPGKNTLDYHAVQHQKTEWIATAAKDLSWDALVWIDYGIFHQEGVTRAAIASFLGRVKASCPFEAVTAPGCWEPREVPRDEPSWRFCGSVLIVPGALAARLDAAVKITAGIQIELESFVHWEVNTWARVEASGVLPFAWYCAGHNVSMFDNFQPAPRS